MVLVVVETLFQDFIESNCVIFKGYSISAEIMSGTLNLLIRGCIMCNIIIIPPNVLVFK